MRYLQQSITKLPIDYALLANQCADPTFDDSKLPAWAQTIISIAHQSPKVYMNNYDPARKVGQQWYHIRR